MNNNTDHLINVRDKPESLARKSNDRLCYQSAKTSEHQGVRAVAPPRRQVSQTPARKAYLAAWKAAHPERQLEYTRRWQLKHRGKVGSSRNWLSHDESLQKMREIPRPFSTEQFALHTGITHGGACNLFKALKEARKIQFVGKQRYARFYEICSSVPTDPLAAIAAGERQQH